MFSSGFVVDFTEPDTGAQDPTLTDEHVLCILNSDESSDADWGWQPNAPVTPIQERLYNSAAICRSFVKEEDHTKASNITFRCFNRGVLIGLMCRDRSPLQLITYQPLDLSHSGKLGPSKKEVNVLSVRTLDCDWMHPLCSNVILSLFGALINTYMVSNLAIELPLILCRVPVMPSILLFLITNGFQPAFMHVDGTLEICCFEQYDLIGSIHHFLTEAVCQHSALSFSQKFLHYVKSQIDNVDVFDKGVYMISVDKLVKQFK